jgi:hypothetical protein
MPPSSGAQGMIKSPSALKLDATELPGAPLPLLQSFRRGSQDLHLRKRIRSFGDLHTVPDILDNSSCRYVQLASLHCWRKPTTFAMPAGDCQAHGGEPWPRLVHHKPKQFATAALCGSGATGRRTNRKFLRGHGSAYATPHRATAQRA